MVALKSPNYTLYGFIETNEHSYCQELRGLMISGNTVHPNKFYNSYFFFKKLQILLKNQKNSHVK